MSGGVFSVGERCPPRALGARAERVSTRGRARLTGTLDLHGVQREVTCDVEARREGNVISALATLTVAFSDFGITPPTFAQLVSIDEQAALQIQLIADAI